ncbi:hypothetical protein LIER_08350 [Lithospermum erythrorhizon]|uniref:Uncharacterized protein n=1 Tax=Lithospermum erythrorhizon TaxID=34254 RepID=A0AAV3PBQ8_LITER
MGVDTPPGPQGHSSPRYPPRDPCQDPPPPANPTLVVAQKNASGQYSATVVLELEYQGGIGSSTPRNPSSVPLSTPKLYPKDSSRSPSGSSLPPRKSFLAFMARLSKPTTVFYPPTRLLVGPLLKLVNWRSFDIDRDLLFKHFSRALERTIRVVQAKLEKDELEVPASLWDAVRGDVSSPDPPSS